jgi:hypothetical protein
MFADIDIRKSALTFLGAAALSITAGLASPAQASLAASGHLALPLIAAVTEAGAQEHSGRNEHRLTRPANRFNGTMQAPGGQNAAGQAE